MVWREVSVSDQRRAFVEMAPLEGANVSALCLRFGISRQTGHLWLRRHGDGGGDQRFEDCSRRPLSRPRQIAEALGTAILAVRTAHPDWGAREIAAVLARGRIASPAMTRRRGPSSKPPGRACPGP